MEDTLKLKTVDIKTLTREDLEAAYLRLLKVSKTKTKLIQFLERSERPCKDSSMNINNRNRKKGVEWLQQQ